MTTPVATKTTPGEYLEHTLGRWSEWPLSHTRFILPSHLLYPMGIQCWIALCTVSRSSHSSKSVDDLIQDEKRQQSFFFSTIPHGIYFLSILIILWSIKACSKSRCILPQADSTCKHFLSRTPLSSPEAKHDYPILMRFLMWFFFSQSLQDNPTLTYVHTVVNVCSLMVCKMNTCWCFCFPQFFLLIL